MIAFVLNDNLVMMNLLAHNNEAQILDIFTILLFRRERSSN